MGDDLVARRGKPGEPGEPGILPGGGKGGTGGEGGPEGEKGRRGATGVTGRRGPRDSRTLLITLCALAGVLLVVVAVWSTVTLIQQRKVERNATTRTDIKREGITRRNETCTLFETDYRTAVHRLEGTYAYLMQLRPAEKDDAINRFVVLNLPTTEAETRAAKAPPFCDEPKVGLAEDRQNNPAVPKRPKGLRLLSP